MEEQDVISIDEQFGRRGEREAMSLKKMMKRRGPRIEPCGTPDETGRELERLVPMRTRWDLPDR